MILYLIIVSVNKKTLDYAWNLMGITVRLAQSVSQILSRSCTYLSFLMRQSDRNS
jgi:hypothetical protein